MEYCPPLRNFEFPPWLVCVCENAEKFDEAKNILTNKFGFIYSPFEPEKKPNRALVLPRPDVKLDEIINAAKERRDLNWGIGRARFATFDIGCNKRGGVHHMS